MADAIARLSPSRQVAAHIRSLIQRGRLRVGDRLPSSRALARELGLAKGTILSAYTSLRDAGVLRPMWDGYVVNEAPLAGDDRAIRLSIAHLIDHLEEQGYYRDRIFLMLRKVLKDREGI